LLRSRLGFLLHSGCLGFTSLSSSFFGSLLLFILLLSLLALLESGNTLFVVRDEFHSSHVLLEALGDFDTSLSLVVLEDAAHSTLSGAHGAVEHVNVELLIGRLQVVAGVKSTGLVIGAVGAGYKFPEVIVAGEPGLKIELGSSGIVKLFRDDVLDSVGELQGLVEGFRSLDDSFKFFPRCLRFAVDELLYFLELMDAENTPDVATVRSSLLSEASGDTSVMLGELSRGEPLLHVHGRDGLLGSGC